MLFAVDLHFGARVLAEEDSIAGFDVELANRAVLENLAVADGDDVALDRLLFRGVRDEETALGLLLLLHAAHDHAILKRPDLHGRIPPRPNEVRPKRKRARAGLAHGVAPPAILPKRRVC